MDLVKLLDYKKGTGTFCAVRARERSPKLGLSVYKPNQAGRPREPASNPQHPKDYPLACGLLLVPE
jgi:hypothetical protein